MATAEVEYDLKNLFFAQHLCIAAGLAADRNRSGKSELEYTLESEWFQEIELGEATYSLRCRSLPRIEINGS